MPYADHAWFVFCYLFFVTRRLLILFSFCSVHPIAKTSFVKFVMFFFLFSFGDDIAIVSSEMSACSQGLVWYRQNRKRALTLMRSWCSAEYARVCEASCCERAGVSERKRYCFVFCWVSFFLFDRVKLRLQVIGSFSFLFISIYLLNYSSVHYFILRSNSIRFLFTFCRFHFFSWVFTVIIPSWLSQNYH